MPGVPHGAKRPRRKVVKRHVIQIAKPRRKPKPPAKPTTPSRPSTPTVRTRVSNSGGLRVKPKSNQKPKPKYKMVDKKVYRPTSEASAGNSASSSNYNVANTRTIQVKKRIKAKKK